MEHIYVISIDNTPLFYTKTREDAKRKIKLLTSRFLFRNMNSIYTYHVESEEGDSDDIIFIKGRLKFTIFAYDRLIHIIRFDRVDKLC